MEEKKRKKAGLITIFNLPNYGSVLQAYATQQIIEECGYHCTVVYYDNMYSDWHNSHTKSRPSWKYRLVGFLGLTNNHRKYRNLQRFYKKHLHLTKRYLNERSLKANNWQDYDIFISGSDQIWNPRFSFGDPVFMLSFVPQTLKRVAISSSFSCNKLDNRYLPIYKKYITRYSAVSVREDNGLAILRDQIGFKGDIAVTLDPTLLVAPTVWEKIDSHKYKSKKGRYILVYMLDYAFNPRPCIYDVISHYEQQLGINAVCLEGNIDKATKKILRINDKTDSSVGDFISLFRNAALVVTSSFHGTAFALNFGVPLVSIVPSNNFGDDRQTTILRKLSLEGCMCRYSSDISSLQPFYDKPKEQEELSILRSKSLSWINEHLK